jgi:hypothetical protein
MDGAGVPVVKAEAERRAGKIEGQPAHTREAKLGCVFTQTATDREGRPVRDEDSTTYTGGIETAEEFGLRIYTEAWRRGWSRAKKKAVLGDGAVWIWNLADRHFPGAIQIVDLYHARQHLWELSAKLFPADQQSRKRWMARSLHQRERGKTEAAVKTLRDLRPASAELAKTVSDEADCFERNAERMRYPAFRAQGLFVGSGEVEAGCKEAIGSRLKRSGMFWTVRGANAIVALRSCRLSGRFEDYWESRRRAVRSSTIMSRTRSIRVSFSSPFADKLPRTGWRVLTLITCAGARGRGLEKTMRGRLPGALLSHPGLNPLRTLGVLLPFFLLTGPAFRAAPHSVAAPVHFSASR